MCRWWRLSLIFAIISIIWITLNIAEAQEQQQQQPQQRRLRRRQASYNSNNNINAINGGGGVYQDSGNNNSPQPYKYEYGVFDPSFGTDFGHREERNSQDETVGEYRVRLPDGRLQIVTYRADRNGYKADVVYQDGGNSLSSAPSGGYGPPPQTSSVNSYSSGGGGGRGRNFVNIMRQINGRSFSHSY